MGASGGDSKCKELEWGRELNLFEGSGGPLSPQILSPGSCVPLLPLSKHQDSVWLLCLQAGALLLGGLACCPSLCEVSLAAWGQERPSRQSRQGAESAPTTPPSVPHKAFNAPTTTSESTRSLLKIQRSSFGRTGGRGQECTFF